MSSTTHPPHSVAWPSQDPSGITTADAATEPDTPSPVEDVATLKQIGVLMTIAGRWGCILRLPDVSDDDDIADEMTMMPDTDLPTSAAQGTIGLCCVCAMVPCRGLLAADADHPSLLPSTTNDRRAADPRVGLCPLARAGL
jgi:hypothetical protein